MEIYFGGLRGGGKLAGGRGGVAQMDMCVCSLLSRGWGG